MYKRTKDVNLISKMKNLDTQYKSKFREMEREKFRKQIRPNDPKTFWNAVNSTLGKSGHSQIPDITHNNATITKNSDKAEAFANFFREKVENIESNYVEERMNDEVQIANQNFITRESLDKVIKSLKPKKSFGFDRTPLIVLKDGYDVIGTSLLNLMEKIYKSNEIPDQWKVARIVPIHKKGNKAMLENYRPISNLCSMAKIFERLILEHIQTLQVNYEKDFTGTEQHGFKKGSSTTTAMLQIQAKIAESQEAGNITSLISLDLSSAFDVVNHELLIKRLKKVGLPNDLIKLIREWLNKREACVEIEGESSYFYKITKGTIQGSVLGPVLFAIFIKDLMRIEPVTIYADDNYLVSGAKTLEELKHKTEQEANKLVKWFTNSGLKVNVTKTELVIFSKNTNLLSIKLDGCEVKSKTTMKVLGVIFDSKQDWSAHINDVINKVSKTQFGLRCLKKYLSINELLNLVTSLGMSRLYYGAPVWLSRGLHEINQRKLMRASAGLIRSCLTAQDWTGVSFVDIHELSGKATPMMMSDYYQAIALKNIYESGNPELVWLKLQVNCRINRRSGSIIFGNGSINLHGKHNLANRLQHVSTRLPHGWEQLSESAFKRLAKRTFINV